MTLAVNCIGSRMMLVDSVVSRLSLPVWLDALHTHTHTQHRTMSTLEEPISNASTLTEMYYIEENMEYIYMYMYLHSGKYVLI